MKAKGKTDKSSQLNILKLNLEKIYTKPFSKPSNAHLSTTHSNNFISQRSPDMRLETDTSRNLHSPPSVHPQLAKKIRNPSIETENLHQFTSNVYGNSKNIDQYLNSLKGHALSHLNYDDMGYLYDIKVPNTSATICESESTRVKKVTDTTATTLGTMGSASRFLLWTVDPLFHSLTSGRDKPKAFSSAVGKKNKKVLAESFEAQANLKSKTNVESIENRVNSTTHRVTIQKHKIKSKFKSHVNKDIQKIISHQKTISHTEPSPRFETRVIVRRTRKSPKSRKQGLPKLKSQEFGVCQASLENRANTSADYGSQEDDDDTDYHNYFNMETLRDNLKKSQTQKIKLIRIEPTTKDEKRADNEQKEEIRCLSPGKTQVFVEEKGNNNNSIKDQNNSNKEGKIDRDALAKTLRLLEESTNKNIRIKHKNDSTEKITIFDHRENTNTLHQKTDVLIKTFSPQKINLGGLKLNIENATESNNHQEEEKKVEHKSPKEEKHFESEDNKSNNKNTAQTSLGAFSGLVSTLLDQQSPLKNKIMDSRSKSRDASISVSPDKEATKKEEKKEEAKPTEDLENSNEAGENLKKKFRKSVRALGIGKTFIASITKSDSKPTPKSNDKKRVFNFEGDSPRRKTIEGLVEAAYTFSGKKMVNGNIPSPLKVLVINSPNKDGEPLAEKRLNSNIPQQQQYRNLTEETKISNITEEEDVPVIRVFSSENGQMIAEHNSRNNSKRTSRIWETNIVENKEAMETVVIKQRRVKEEPKTWFDFKDQKLQPKLHKLKVNNHEGNSTSELLERQNEFVSAFDQFIKQSTKLSVSIPLNKATEGNLTPSKRVSLTLASKKSPPLEELLKQDFDEEETFPKEKKTMTLESEGTVMRKLHAAQKIQAGAVTNLTHGVTISTNEEANKNSLKKYSRRDAVIIININPPIEEAINSKMEETMSPVTATTNQRVEMADSHENSPTSPNGEMTNPDFPKKVQYTFDVNHRKPIDEDSFLFDDLTPKVVNAFDQSFRHRAEEHFKFDEIYKSTMDNFNTKSHKLRIRSNFLTFIEKALIVPTDTWIHGDLIHNYLLQQNKKTDPSMNEILNKDNNFEYEPKSFPLLHNPFRNNLIFLLTKNDVSTENKNTKLKPEDMFEEDESPQQDAVIKSTNLIFESGEVVGTESILNQYGYEDYKITLMLKPIMGSVTFDAILSMKKTWFKYSFRDLRPGKAYSQMSFWKWKYLSTVLEIANDDNWKYLCNCMEKMYKLELFGNFEFKQELGTEKILRESQFDLDEEDVEEPKQPKKRDLMIAGKMWRSTSTVNTIIKRRSNKRMTAGSETSPKANARIASLVEERKEEDEEDGKDKKGDHLKVARQRVRRASKTSVKPLSHSGTLQKPSSSNIEKSNSAFVEITKAKDLVPGIPEKKRNKTNKVTSTDSTSDRTGRLQIPRMNSSNRQAALNSSHTRQETKAEIAEKLAKKHTVNSSLTPTSDPSSPGKDEIALNFQNQSTLGAQWNRERTKTKIEGSERSSIRREASYGAISQTREKEETPQQILLEMQSKAKEEINLKSPRIAAVAAPGQSKKEQANREGDKTQFMGSMEEFRPIKNERISIGGRKKAKKVLPEQSLEKLLFEAVYSNKFLEIRELLNLYPKAVLHIRDKQMNTLLIAAARAGYKEIVELLLNQGCDPNAQNEDGNTALHICLSYHHYDIGDILVRHGAKQSVLNAKGKTAWDEVS